MAHGQNQEELRINNRLLLTNQQRIIANASTFENFATTQLGSIQEELEHHHSDMDISDETQNTTRFPNNTDQQSRGARPRDPSHRSAFAPEIRRSSPKQTNSETSNPLHNEKDGPPPAYDHYLARTPTTDHRQFATLGPWTSTQTNTPAEQIPNTHTRRERTPLTNEETIHLLIEENRRRDAMLMEMINRLLPQGNTAGPQENRNAPMNYSILPDLTKTIGDFNGETGGYAAREWLEKLESMSRLHRWPENVALETARSHLIGGALDWYRCYRGEMQNWRQFYDRFHATFVTAESYATKWKRMVERVQGKAEPLTTYFHAKTRMCSAVHLDVAETKEQILVGLWSRDLCNTMSAREHVDMTTLLQDMQAHERLEAQRVNRLRLQRETSYDRSRTTPNTTRPPPTTTSSTAPNNPNSTRSTASRDIRPPLRNERGEPKCYNCNEYGHLSRDCPAPKRERYCVKCRQTGHTQLYCPTSTTTNTSTNPTTTTATAESPRINMVTTRTTSGQAYLKDVRVNNNIIKGFVDTGSSDCTIKASTVLRYGLCFEPQSVTFRCFGPDQHQIQSMGRVVIAITIDDVTVEDVPLRVVPDDFQLPDTLIGRTFTDAPGVGYEKHGDQLTFFRETVPEDLEPSARRPTVTHPTEIPPRTVQFVQVMTEMGEIELPLVNHDASPKKIDKKTKMECCTISPVPVIPASVKRQPVVREELDCGENISEQELEELLALLNEFRDTIAMNVFELGKTDLIKMDIKTIPGSKPPQCKPYRASPREREEMSRIVREWKAAGIVRETNSPYASPAFVIKKKNGESRLVVDYRAVNKQTERINFPLPDLDAHLEEIGGFKLFITLDMAQGYLQIPLNEEDTEKTAFITPDDTGEFTTAMFGLMNAPFYFMKAVRKALMPLFPRIVYYFLDDILIPGHNWPDLKEKLRLVLTALRHAGFTLNVKKCQFLKERVTYLGFEISGNAISPGETKLQAIIGFRTPMNIHEVRRFLGLSGFFRRFIVKYAEKAAPLYQLLKKDVPFQWNEDAARAFQNLRDALACRPVLKPYNPKHLTELHTDASAEGLAAMLMQKGEDNKWHLVYAISRRTSEIERNYHSSKLELMAIIWAIHRLRPMLINISFVIVTDCQALVYLNAKRTQQPQIARWAIQLSEYDVEIRHRPGVQMTHVDALSRAPANDISSTERTPEVDETNRSIFILINEDDEVIMYQCNDETLKRKQAILAKPERERSQPEKDEVRDYELCDGIVYKTIDEKRAYVVPKALRKSLAIRFHDLRGHPGLERCLKQMREYYYFPAMKRYLRQHLNACIQCALVKTKPGRQAGQLHPIPPGRRPFETIHIDHSGPYVTSVRKNKYVFVIVDNLTRFVTLRAVRDTKTFGVVKTLNDFVLQYGAPLRIISDRGTCFTSKQFSEFCETHGIKHVMNSPRHPQANGMVERVNATMLPGIQASILREDGKDWDAHLKEVQRNLNAAPNQTTGKSPFELLYGYTPRFEEGYLRYLTNESGKRYTAPADLQTEARERIFTEQAKYKARYDAGRDTHAKFQRGDIVFMTTATVATGESTKLQTPYRGPLVITEALSNDTYRVTQLRTDTPGRRYASTAHASQLKVWKTPPGDNEAENYEEEDPESEPDDERVTTNRRPQRLRQRPDRYNP